MFAARANRDADYSRSLLVAQAISMMRPRSLTFHTMVDHVPHGLVERLKGTDATTAEVILNRLPNCDRCWDPHVECDNRASRQELWELSWF